jgi:hypothetical protein
MSFNFLKIDSQFLKTSLQTQLPNFSKKQVFQKNKFLETTVKKQFLQKKTQCVQNSALVFTYNSISHMHLHASTSPNHFLLITAYD